MSLKGIGEAIHSAWQSITCQKQVTPSHCKPTQLDMSKPHEEVPGTDSNPDPITGAPGSHPLGTGIGAASGAATGAAIGAIGGPVGALVGGAIGAVTGGFVGKGVEEHYDPTVEDAYWQQNHSIQTYAGTTGKGYDDYATAYTTGHQGASEYASAGSKFADVEDKLKAKYEQTAGAATLPWSHAKEATRAAFDRVGGQRDIVLKEEQLKVGKREVSAGEVQIRKTVQSEQVNIPVELKREDVTIERVSAGDVRAGTVASNFQEETIDVPLDARRSGRLQGNPRHGRGARGENLHRRNADDQ